MKTPCLALLIFSACLAWTNAQGQTPPDSAPAQEKPAPRFTTSDTPLNLQLIEGTVELSWTLPEGDIRKVDICSHVLSRIEGRRRVATVTKNDTTWSEALPDTKRNYWYSIKVTLADDTVINIGPASTKTVTK